MLFYYDNEESLYMHFTHMGKPLPWLHHFTKKRWFGSIAYFNSATFYLSACINTGHVYGCLRYIQKWRRDRKTKATTPGCHWKSTLYTNELVNKNGKSRDTCTIRHKMQNEDKKNKKYRILKRWALRTQPNIASQAMCSRMVTSCYFL